MEKVKYHWFFDYEEKEWRVVAETFESAARGLANLIGKPFEELRNDRKVYFTRVEDNAGNLIYKAP